MFCKASEATDKDRSAGLLTMIRIQSVSERHIRIRRALQGRFDRIRIDTQRSSADLLNIYQKAVSFTQSQEAYEKCNSIWKTVSAVLSTLSSRNLLALQGDLNIQLKTFRPWMRPCVTLSDQDEQISKDHQDLLDILQRFDLRVLNSWSYRRPYIYVHGAHNTLTDYIIMRRIQSIRRAKQSRPVHDDSFIGWGDSKHYPVFAQLTHNRQTTPKNRRYDIQKILIQDNTQQEYLLQDEKVQAATQNLSSATYSQLPTILQQICTISFMATKARSKPSWCEIGMRSRVSSMWHVTNCLKDKWRKLLAALPRPLRTWSEA